MKQRIKELVETLLRAIIEDGKAGINNSLLDKNWDNFKFETSKIDDAVILFLQLVNEGNIDFKLFNDAIKKSIRCQCTMVERINQLLDWYESIWEKAFDFNDDEINELANLIEQEK